MQITDLTATLLDFPPKLATSPSITIYDNAATRSQIQALAEKIQSVISLSIIHSQLTELPDLTRFGKFSRLMLKCPKITHLTGEEIPSDISSISISTSEPIHLSNSFWQKDPRQSITLVGTGFINLKLPAEINVERLMLETSDLKSIHIDGPQSILGRLNIISRALKNLNEDFENFQAIKNIMINAPIETADFKFDSNVKLLSLRFHHLMPTNAKFLQTLPEIALLQISAGGRKAWSGLPDINQWKNLGNLLLNNCQDTELSEQPLAGKNLNRIDLRNCQLNFRPEIFRESSGLNYVSLSKVPPVNIIDCIKYIPQVGTWNFHEVELIDFEKLSSGNTAAATSLYLSDVKNEIVNFDFLDAFPNLTSLHVQGEQPIPYSAFLREKAVPLEYIKRFIPAFKYENSKQFCGIASAICNSGMPREDQEYLVDFIANQKTLQIPKNWDWPFLLKATNISYPTFKKKLRSRLEEKSEQALSTQPLDKNSVVYLTGKSKIKATELKRICEALGVPLVKKYNDQVSHVLVGTKSQDYDLLKDKKFTPVTDTQLAQIHKSSEPQFLKDQEKTEDGSVPTALENLDQLLSTDDTPTLLMALEMVKQGGLPEKSVGTLLVKHKTTKDAKVRKKSKELLELYADAMWRPLLSDRGSFKNIYNQNKREVDTRRQFKDLAKRTSPTLAGNFSCLLFEKTGKGLRYALTASLKKDLKKKAYQLLLKDQSFNFSQGLGYSDRGNKHNKFEVEYAMPELSVSLPVLALELDTIRTLDLTNCRYESLSEKIGQFKDLQHLILAINELRSLPDIFSQLTELESIDLRDNLFTSFPATLGKLPKLTKVDLRANKVEKVPETFVRSHSNCTVLIDD